MAYYYDDHYWNHDLTRNLAHRLSRESRHSGHTTQYIVNEGRMVVNEKTLRHSNAVIYNAPGSSLRFAPSRHTSYSSIRHSSHYAPESSSWTTSPSTSVCRGCYEHRELYYGNYCHKCTSIRQVSWPNESYRLRDREYRYITRAPERKLVTWR
ncbi:hypothetical protein F4781DRAFT_386809, partial [Annulohypoxylon bovei var. microspora]